MLTFIYLPNIPIRCSSLDNFSWLLGFDALHSEEQVTVRFCHKRWDQRELLRGMAWVGSDKWFWSTSNSSYLHICTNSPQQPIFWFLILYSERDTYSHLHLVLSCRWSFLIATGETFGRSSSIVLCCANQHSGCEVTEKDPSTVVRTTYLHINLNQLVMRISNDGHIFCQYTITYEEYKKDLQRWSRIIHQ